MTVTTTPRLGLHQWGAGSDPFTRSQMNAAFNALETNAAMFSSGADINARPAAGKAGRFYLDLSVGALWYDNGTTWVMPNPYGETSHRASAGQINPLRRYLNSAGTEIAQVSVAGQSRWRGAASLLARSAVEAGVASAADSRVTLGAAGTTGSAADTPSIDLLRAASGSAGQAWRISAPSATGPLEIGGSDSGSATWGSENILPRLKIGRPSSVSDHALTVRGITGQSGEMLRCENGSGTTIASIYANGGAHLAAGLSCASVSSSGGVSGTTLSATSTGSASNFSGPVNLNGSTTANNLTVNGSLNVPNNQRAVIGLTSDYAHSSTANVFFSAVDTAAGNGYVLTGGMSQSAGLISIPETGYYMISAAARMTKASPSNEPIALYARKNSSTTLIAAWGSMNSQSVSLTCPVRPVYLIAGDTVQFGASAASGISTVASSAGTYLSLVRC